MFRFCSEKHDFYIFTVLLRSVKDASLYQCDLVFSVLSGMWEMCHTMPFSCRGLCMVVVICGLCKEGASVHRNPASSVKPRPPHALNMDQPYP